MIKWSPHAYARQGNFRLFQILNPKFLVFHLPEAGQVQRCYALRLHSVCLFENRDRAGRSPGNLVRLTLQLRPVPGTLVGRQKGVAVPYVPGDDRPGKPYTNFDGWSVVTVFPPWREDYGNNPLFHAPEKMDSDVESTRCNFSSRMRI